MDPLLPIVARPLEPAPIAPAAPVRPIGRRDREAQERGQRRHSEPARAEEEPPGEDDDGRPHVDLRA